MNWLYFTLLVLHIAICIFAYIAMYFKLLKASSYLIPILLFVPVFGFITLLITERMTRRGLAGTRDIDLEELLMEGNDFRRIRHEEEKTVKTVVPLEEAIRINDTQVRRKLMMDIMKQEPDKFIKLLREARLNDDMEVTHYASTAMMEVQRKYEVDIQRYEKAIKSAPGDIQILTSYLKVLRSYIDSGMLEDNMMIIQRVRYDTLLRRMIADNPSDKQPYIDATENLIEIGYYDQAEKMILTLSEKWPNEENTWILKLKLYFESRNKVKFEETLSEIKRKKVYFSSQYRRLVSFWDPSIKGAENIG